MPQVEQLQERRTTACYAGTHWADQLGTVKTLIDGIALGPDAFAVIAMMATGSWPGRGSRRPRRAAESEAPAAGARAGSGSLGMVRLICAYRALTSCTWNCFSDRATSSDVSEQATKTIS